MDTLILENIDIAHLRLVELTHLADQAEPFYLWVERRLQDELQRQDTLNTILLTASQAEITSGIRACYAAQNAKDVPFLFDGVGRSYSHAKACYYFFAWLVRDAPQQRLAPLLSRTRKHTSKTKREIEVEALALLIYNYRSNLKTFAWEAIREVILDRLEGSRRSIKGHENEVIVRTAIVTAVQAYYFKHGGYGVYAGVRINPKQIQIGGESYDVSLDLFDDQQRIQCRLLIPIKTRETEGGGHAHLFSRDVLSAVQSVAQNTIETYVAVIIIAQNWSQREADNLANRVDYLAWFGMPPGAFQQFDADEQARLNAFIAQILSGTRKPILA